MQIVCAALEMPAIKHNVLMYSICVLFFAWDSAGAVSGYKK